MDNCTLDILNIDKDQAHDIVWNGAITPADKSINMPNSHIREYKFDDNVLYTRRASNIGEWIKMSIQLNDIEPTKNRAIKKIKIKQEENNTQSTTHTHNNNNTCTSTRMEIDTDNNNNTRHTHTNNTQQEGYWWREQDTQIHKTKYK